MDDLHHKVYEVYGSQDDARWTEHPTREVLSRVGQLFFKDFNYYSSLHLRFWNKVVHEDGLDFSKIHTFSRSPLGGT